MSAPARTPTEFERRVYGALLEIPRGRVATYSGLAARLGGTVERRLRIIRTADHSHDFAIRSHCDQSDLRTAQPPSSGRITFAGAPYRPSSPDAAKRAGE